MAKKLTNEEVKERISNLYNGEYELISDYTLSTEPITLKHKCGNEYIIKRAKTFLKEHKGLCPICNKPKPHSTKRLTEDIVKERINKIDSGEYEYIGGFVNSNTKIRVLHKTCNNIFQTTPHMILGMCGTRCPICANLNRGKYAIKENYLDNLLKDKPYGNEYQWLEIYKNNNKEKHLIKHLKCNTIYEVRPNDFQQGYQCPHCTTNSSKEELELIKFIKDNYRDEIKTNFRFKHNSYELDVYLPKLSIGFEYNGTYWHSDKFKDKNYHLNKMKYFKNLGIEVYFIDSSDWINKKEIIKSKIIHLLKCNKCERIFARNTTVKLVDSKDKRKFLNNNHIQGYAIDKFGLGLYYNSKLVALMTFAVNRKNVNIDDNSKIELLRYATDINFQVVGGFSKLLKHSIDYIKDNFKGINKIITYADLQLSRGNVYYKNNFKLDHISKPSYFYELNGVKYNRYKFRKSKLKEDYPQYYDENISEIEITNKIPSLYRHWNCGNLVFNYDI